MRTPVGYTPVVASQARTTECRAPFILHGGAEREGGREQEGGMEEEMVSSYKGWIGLGREMRMVREGRCIRGSGMLGEVV